MLDTVFQKSEAAAVILSLSAILLAAFLLTRITKKLRLPNVTGYIFAGVLLGPYVLKVVPTVILGRMDFVTDIALAFIAFGTGKYFKFSALKKSGKQTVIITVFEALMAAVVISLTMIFVFHLSVPFSILLGAIGCATAPASTIMTIRQYKAKGKFVNMILQVVALDDAVALIAFSVCAAIAQAMESDGGFSASVIVLPIIINVLAVGLGIFGGWVLSKLINDNRSYDHRLVVVVAILLALTGFCTALDVSPLLACMALGTAYMNLSGNKKLFKQVNKFTPPLLAIFFVLSGMRLDIPSLATAGIIGVVYFFVRIIGKYIGSYFGALVSHSDKSIRNYLGLALIPQAGVSIGLAALGQRILPTESGLMLSTIILSSAILYEMVGPAAAKASLILSRCIGREDTGGKGEKTKLPQTDTPLDQELSPSETDELFDVLPAEWENNPLPSGQGELNSQIESEQDGESLEDRQDKSTEKSSSSSEPPLSL
jgi:Kef-type K+ transport system membrane component KefB